MLKKLFGLKTSPTSEEYSKLPELIRDTAQLLSQSVSEADAYEQLIAKGYDEGWTGEAITFIPIAYGLKICSELGVKHPVNRNFIVSTQNRTEERSYDNEPCFIAIEQSMNDVRRQLGEEGFSKVAARSAHLRGLNALMQNGSQPQDIVFSPSNIPAERLRASH